jgi:basic membrane protein A
MKPSLFPAISFVLLTLLVGCSMDSKESSASSSDSAGKMGAGTLVGVVFDSGGRGDKSFNDSAFAGAERARTELGVEIKTVDSRKESDYDDNISAMAEAGSKIVFAVGLGQATALEEVAPKFPDVKFAIVDSVVDLPNVRSLLFAEEQGSFLAGYAAGLSSKTGKVGFVGGKNIPLIHKFEAGFTAGARMANPSIQVLPAKYTDSWDDTGKGKAAAGLLYGQGADVVYHAAGRCGLGVFAAAKEANGSGPVTKFAIGVDSNQDDVEKGIVLTSMIKRVDEAVYSTIKDVLDDKFTPGTKLYDVAARGVGLTDFKNTKDVIGAENLKKIEEISEKIKSGSYTIPAKREDVESFLKANK